MAVINLAERVQIAEGTHNFKIVKVDYKEDFQKLTLTLATQDGNTMNKVFSFLNKNGEIVSGALNIFSWMARVALKSNDAEQVDPNDLLGCFIQADVTKDVQPKRDNPAENVTFFNIGNFKECDCFENGNNMTEKELKAVGIAPQTAQSTPKPADDLDLDSLFG